MQFYGTRLSENISRRESTGALLCLNVPVARTGIQEYLPEELGLGSGSGMIPVYRPAEEVFSPEAIASFEGMPVTNDHPPDEVNIHNIRRLQMGHAQNDRRGSGEESDLLLADLVITDPGLIDAILNGKREISCGYTYELDEENGQYIQRKIRANHVAIVDAGRAGPRVSIKDHQNNKREERKNTMKNPIVRKLVTKAKAGDTEAIELLAEAAEEAAAGEPVTVEVPENREITIDEESIASLCAEVRKTNELLAQLLSPAPAEDEDPEEETVSELVSETVEAAVGEGLSGAEAVEEIMENVLENPEVSITLEEKNEEDEECDDPEAERKEALTDAMMAISPVLKGMTKKQRKKACADIASRYARRQKKRSRSNLDTLIRERNIDRNGTELGKRIMAKRNAICKLNGGN